MRMERTTQVRGLVLGAILVIGLACAAAWPGSSSAAAVPSAAPRAIASVSADVPISGGGGWLVWSVPATGGWGLEAYHDGALETLQVAPRSQPFDLSVGTDSHGAPVATFSRCTRTPKMEVPGSEGIGGALLVPQAGAGCRIHMLELASGRESTLPIPRPAASSDTTPSMWRGSVAFARKTPRHRAISQVMLWSPRHPHTLRTLPSGVIPSCPTKRDCAWQPVEAEVQSLDLDAHVVTFLWRVQGPNVLGHVGWEERVDALANAHSSLAGSGFNPEACGGRGLESAYFEPPVAVGYRVLFSQYERYSCYKRFTSSLNSYRAGAVRRSSGPLSGIVLGLARDGNAIYTLAAPAPEFQMDPSCSPKAPCQLEQIVKPALAPKFKPAPPFS
jgi:hypothetical protein